MILYIAGTLFLSASILIGFSINQWLKAKRRQMHTPLDYADPATIMNSETADNFSSSSHPTGKKTKNPVYAGCSDTIISEGSTATTTLTLRGDSFQNDMTQLAHTAAHNNV
jgi:hypothetical protein